jgi:DNA-binding transcriptional LysR family regulator
MSDLIELRHLKNFIAVAEAGNISRAAEILFISQSCLSGQMKQLEEAAQVCLLVRHSGGVHATPAAKILIAGSKHILKLRDDLLTATRSAETIVILPMRLGFSSFVDHDLYEMVCSVHTALYPTCEIKSRGGDNVELLTRIKLVVQAQSQPDNIASIPLLTATFVRPVRPVAVALSTGA